MTNDQSNSKSKIQHSKVFGLIGFPLTHSFSKKYFAEKFKRENISDCVYENFPLTSIAEFPALIKANPDLLGLNVTIPYKEQVLKFLDEAEESAKEIGAVNTIKISNGKLMGFNTDAFGFIRSLTNLLPPVHPSSLILGTGGSSKAVAYGLRKMGIEFDFVSRTPAEKQLSYDDLDEETIRTHKIIVNTTPLGMFPDIDACPQIPYEYLLPSHLLYDLIYNPGETLFLRKGRERGTQTKNGLEMLQLQAEKSWQIWNTD